jgi:ABC-type lipoprotein release transport system permease subunit
VAVSGTLMGVGIALIATWGLTTSKASWAEGLHYGVAWRDIVLIVGLAVIAALAAAILPARAASDIEPAVALRIADKLLDQVAVTNTSATHTIAGTQSA